VAGLLRGLGHEERIRLGHLCAAAALTGHRDIARLRPLHRLEELLEVGVAEWTRREVASKLAKRIA
jgi:2-dehydro-3-deoxygluconokinase